MQGFHPCVSLRLGHDTAPDATGIPPQAEILYRVAASLPTKNLFEKRFLELEKL